MPLLHCSHCTIMMASSITHHIGGLLYIDMAHARVYLVVCGKQDLHGVALTLSLHCIPRLAVQSQSKFFTLTCRMLPV